MKIISSGLISFLLFASVINHALASENQTKFLVLDSRIIKSTVGAKLTLGKVKKDKRNPLFTEDKPWEPRFDNLYANVIYDEEDKLYKCWYSPFIIDKAVSATLREKYNSVRYLDVLRKQEKPHREMGVCYATSKDGINWEKPELGIVEFEGSKKNNIVFRGPHGAGVFKDSRETDPAKRYKMFFKSKMISVAFSPDGLNWTEPIPCPEANVAGDTHNNAFWAPTLCKYVGITRMWDRVRQVGRTESEDFLKWTKAEVVLEGVEPHLQTYSMPVFYYAGIYIGLPSIYNTLSDRVQTELAWSADTVKWYRVSPGTPLIPCSEKKDAYDWGCVYTAVCPIFQKYKILLYYGGSNGPHFDWRDGSFCLATLRPDGFAGYEPVSSDKPAVITTKLVLAVAGSLCVSADVAPSGFVKVTLLDKESKLLAEGELIAKTGTDAEVQWKKGFSLEKLKGKEIRLNFELRDAKLYSFSFID